MVGCGDATDRIQENQNVTVSCAEGSTGYVYAELLDFSVKSSSVGDMPDLPLKVMMNVGNPDRAFDFACLPNEGVGLARLEFIINRMIGVHPRALLEFDDREPGLQNEIRELMKGYDSPREFYVGRLTEGSPPSAPLSIETGDRASVGLQIERIRQLWWAASAMSRKKRTRCSASAAPDATFPASATASPLSAKR